MMLAGIPQQLINRLLHVFEYLTGFITQITSDHAYIHDGISFSIALDVGSISDVYYIALETPSTESGKYVHYRPSGVGLTSDADSVKFEMKGPITSYTGGTAYTPFNRNQTSSNISLSTVKYNVTSPVLGDAILMDIESIGTTGNPSSKSGGSGGGADDELLFEPDSIYLFSFTPGGATNVTFKNFWYEEDGV